MEPDDKLRIDYEAVQQCWRTLTDIRFRLVALLPLFGSAGIALAVSQKMSGGPLVALAILGFAYTLGVIIYDQRNTQFYNDGIARAKWLEGKLGFKPHGKNAPESFPGGLFTSRPGLRRYFFGVAMWHDRALNIIYAATLGAWLYLGVIGVLTSQLVDHLVRSATWPSTTLHSAAYWSYVFPYRVAVPLGMLAACMFYWRLMATDVPPKQIYLSLGSNLDDRARNLEKAIKRIRKSGISVKRESAVYETEPVDYLQQGKFLNCVVHATTTMSVWECFLILRGIENEMGSIKLIPKGPRIIDIDILLWGMDTVENPQLQVPHPRMKQRRFVLVPLAEIAPKWRHPSWNGTVADLLRETTDRSEVRLFKAS